MSRRVLLLAVLVTGIWVCAAQAQTYQVHLSCPALIAIPTDVGGETVVFVRNAAGQWGPADFRRENGRIIISLDPSKLGGGQAILMVNPPKGITLDDSKPPVVTGVTIDGKAVADAPQIDLGWIQANPRLIAIAVADADNPLVADSLRVTVNGAQLKSREAQLAFVDEARRSGVATIRPGRMLHRQRALTSTIRVDLADASPDRNVVARTITYTCLEYLAKDVALLVDSALTGYEDLDVMIDGEVMEKGVTTYGCTWASEEKSGDHWVVLAWPRPREISRAEVSWAVYSDTYWAASRLLAQVWDGEQWVTVKELGDNPATVSTVLELPKTTTDRLRILQPSGGGHPNRPNIMWITEIEVD